MKKAIKGEKIKNKKLNKGNLILKGKKGIVPHFTVSNKLISFEGDNPFCFVKDSGKSATTNEYDPNYHVI